MILERLLAPMGLETFYAEYHDEKPFLLKGVADFREWMSFDALDHIIATQGLRHPAFRMARDSVVVKPEQISLPSVGWGGGAVRDFGMPDRIFALMAQGTSLVLDDADLLHPPLAAPARQLQRELQCNVTTHVFCTPAGEQAFKPHFDIHNVFLVQVEGSKYWRIHEHDVHKPLRTQKDSTGCEPGELWFEGLVEAGDVLYIPRGTVHYGQTRDQPSLHASLSTTPFTWHEVLRNTLKHADDPWLDQPAPLRHRGDIELDDADDEAFDDMLERVLEGSDPSPAFDRLARVWVHRRLSLGVRLSDLEHPLTAETPVRRRASIVERVEGTILSFELSDLEIPADRIELITSGATTPAGRIGLDLATRLLDAGYLEVVS